MNLYPFICSFMPFIILEVNMFQHYVISKVLNNNVILVTDRETDQELVLVGRGIGFAKKEGEITEISKKNIEKSFVAYDEKNKHEYFQLIKQIDPNIIGLSEEIIAIAEERLGQLNSHIHIALTDHIGFAIDRLKSGMEINNPFIHEIKVLYPEEFKMGKIAANMIKERLNVEISESEIGFITLHFHSARQNKRVKDTLKDTKLVKDIIDLIESELSIYIDNDQLTYSRLINHLRLCLNRVENEKYIENPLLEDIKEKFKNSFKIARMIGEYIEKEKNVKVTEDELGYLALHIERIYSSIESSKRRVTELNQA